MTAVKTPMSWKKKLKSILLYSLLFIVFGWGIDLWRAQTIASGTAPELLTSTVQGQQVDLFSMSQERPVLVYFWAAWCAACRFVSPSVDLFTEHYQVVAVALTSGDNKRIQRYLAAKEYNFAVVNDASGLISREWGVSVTPTLLVINKGQITSVTTGFTSPLGIWARLLFA